MPILFHSNSRLLGCSRERERERERDEEETRREHRFVLSDLSIPADPCPNYAPRRQRERRGGFDLEKANQRELYESNRATLRRRVTSNERDIGIQGSDDTIR